MNQNGADFLLSITLMLCYMHASSCNSQHFRIGVCEVCTKLNIIHILYPVDTTAHILKPQNQTQKSITLFMEHYQLPDAKLSTTTSRDCEVNKVCKTIFDKGLYHSVIKNGYVFRKYEANLH